MKVRIEGSGHCVEIEADDGKLGAAALANLAEATWKRTRVDQPRLTMGYAGQLSHTTGDRPLQGSGDRQRQVDPVKA